MVNFKSKTNKVNSDSTNQPPSGIGLDDHKSQKSKYSFAEELEALFQGVPRSTIKESLDTFLVTKFLRVVPLTSTLSPGLSPRAERMKGQRPTKRAPRSLKDLRSRIADVNRRIKSESTILKTKLPDNHPLIEERNGYFRHLQSAKSGIPYPEYQDCQPAN